MPDSPAPRTFAPLDLAPAPHAEPSAENPVFSGWDVALIAGATLVLLFLSQTVVAIVALHYFYRHATLADIAQKPVLALASELLAYLAVAAFMILWIEGKYRIGFWRAIGWNWPSSQWRFLVGGVLMLMGLSIVEHLLPMPKNVPFDKFFQHPRDAYLTSLFAVSLGPLMEELFFRGFLYPVLARRIGVVWAVFFTALPFGLLHAFQFAFAWAAVLVIFIVGVVLTSVRASTKSVAASFLVHVGYNGTLMLLAAISTGGFQHMEKTTALLL